MAGEFGREHISKVLARAVDMIDEGIKNTSETLGDIPYGMVAPSAADLFRIFQTGVAAYPPELAILPDGTRVFESPWVLALQTKVEGGKEFLAKYRKAARRELNNA